VRYQFQRTVVVDGVRHDANDVVYATALPEGAIDGLLRMGHVVPFSAPTPTPALAQEPVTFPTAATEIGPAVEPALQSVEPAKKPAKK